ncbi:Fic family protein [Streptomyces xinghaiensis]|uniref:Fic family protein n=1 Tax=Streptomyces xinghaiensis TaxID=1038928 RepID=UPI0002FD02CE|nr:Fic family protein [Streptomyces xinghaiensis]
MTGELVEWLNTDDGTHPLVRAAMAHLHLVSIHPWADGNGRMSRSLQTLVIAREGELAPEFSSIEAWLGRPGNTWEYYRELQRRGAAFRPDQDVSDWVRFNLTAYHQQAQTVRSRLDRSSRVWLCSVSSRRTGGWGRGWLPLCMTWRCPGGCVAHATNVRRI